MPVYVVVSTIAFIEAIAAASAAADAEVRRVRAGVRPPTRRASGGGRVGAAAAAPYPRSTFSTSAKAAVTAALWFFAVIGSITSGPVGTSGPGGGVAGGEEHRHRCDEGERKGRQE